MPFSAPRIAASLLEWYDAHHRVLPWRALPGEKADPYRVVVSEFMLQQTVAATVVPYFERFMARWPGFLALAAAPVEDVMAAWAGLGYYARARNLHALARAVAADEGILPADRGRLLALPGIGPYTAGAILAIAFDQKQAAVDGNVERVMARLFAVEEPLPDARPKLRQLAESVVPARRAGDFAQALMDLGSSICTPRSPKCMLCPLQPQCLAAARGIACDLPRRRPRKARPTRYGIVYWAEAPDGRVLLVRRPPKGLLGGMLGFPGSPWVDAPVAGYEHAPTAAAWRLLEGKVLHSFTHFDLVLAVARASVSERLPDGIEGAWYFPAEFSQIALPSVMQKVHRHLGEGK